MLDTVRLARRETVVRRLLAAGMTPRILAALLPDWEPVITGVAGDPRG